MLHHLKESRTARLPSSAQRIGEGTASGILPTAATLFVDRLGDAIRRIFWHLFLAGQHHRMRVFPRQFGRFDGRHHFQHGRDQNAPVGDVVRSSAVVVVMLFVNAGVRRLLLIWNVVGILLFRQDIKRLVHSDL